MKLDHIPAILPQTGCLAKFGYFWHFFYFSNITAKLFILEENFCPLKFRSHQDASFPLIGRSLRPFLAELSQKNRLELSNLQDPTKSLEILT